MPSKDDSATFALLGSDTGMGGPMTFPEFPGIWNVGETKTGKELGFETDDEAREQLVRSGVPVVEVDASGRKKPVPPSITQKVSEEMAEEEQLAEDRDEI